MWMRWRSFNSVSANLRHPNTIVTPKSFGVHPNGSGAANCMVWVAWTRPSIVKLVGCGRVRKVAGAAKTSVSAVRQNPSNAYAPGCLLRFVRKVKRTQTRASRGVLVTPLIREGSVARFLCVDVLFGAVDVADASGKANTVAAVAAVAVEARGGRRRSVPLVGRDG